MLLSEQAPDHTLHPCAHLRQEMGLRAVGVGQTPGPTAPSSPKRAPRPQNTRAGALVAATFKLSSDTVLRPSGGYRLSNTTQKWQQQDQTSGFCCSAHSSMAGGPGRPVCVTFSSLNKRGFLPQSTAGCMCDRVTTGPAGSVRLRVGLAGARPASRRLGRHAREQSVCSFMPFKKKGLGQLQRTKTGLNK